MIEEHNSVSEKNLLLAFGHTNTMFVDNCKIIMTNVEKSVIIWKSL
mgnify:CR=1 FL=1